VIIKRILEKNSVTLEIQIGTMIEVPRAAFLANKIARYADFFSFGTNDLTQTTFAFSRDDIASFLPFYVEHELLECDPFEKIDQEGVGLVIEMAVSKGRATKENLKIGICGEQGGEPTSIDFCYRSGLSYVSCSPFRVPIARLAGAQSVIRNRAR
jgi:pyruvate,orthophosphate dikinase